MIHNVEKDICKHDYLAFDRAIGYQCPDCGAVVAKSTGTAPAGYRCGDCPGWYIKKGAKA